MKYLDLKVAKRLCREQWAWWAENHTEEPDYLNALRTKPEFILELSLVAEIKDGTIVGGLGSAVLEFMSDHGYQSIVKRLGVPDHFVDHGTQQELYLECGYDVESIIKTIKAMVKKRILYHAG